AVGRREQLVERVALLLAGGPGGAREEVEVVVAEHARDRGLVLARPAEHVERARAAVHEIADQPEVVVAREVDERQETLEARHAALDVTDGVASHVPFGTTPLRARETRPPGSRSTRARGPGASDLDPRRDEAGPARAGADLEHAAAAHQVRRPRGVRRPARPGIGRQVRAGVEAVAPSLEMAEDLVRGARIDQLAPLGARGGVDRLVELELPGR